MPEPLPATTQFRIERQDNGLVHFVFDCPGRTINVFSNKAIHELGEFAEWLHQADDVRGVIVRSGKDTGFCAGADLTELGVAYEMIVAAKPADRFNIAFDHFFPLSCAIRRLETAGKPVAAAIGGIALGGGCELALGCHYRVLADIPRAVMGLPESQVGLLPGAGGTQRMPRLVGIDAGLQVLLQGKTYAGDEAVNVGLVHELVKPSCEVAAAESWLLSDSARAVQPWDESRTKQMPHSALAQTIERFRTKELERMLGHEPAPIAILDCVELGMMQPIDGAIRSEMSVFAGLIARPEPRNMIRTLFLGKQAYNKADRAGEIAPVVPDSARKISALAGQALVSEPDLHLALLGGGKATAQPVQTRVGEDLWLLNQPKLMNALAELLSASREVVAQLSEAELLQLDHLVTREGTIPAYLGGVSGLASIRALPFA